MTEFTTTSELVLPVAIGTISLLGHQLAEESRHMTSLNALLEASSQVAFSRPARARTIHCDSFEETNL